MQCVSAFDGRRSILGRRRERRAIILVIVLVAIVVMTLSAYTTCKLMQLHRHAARAAGRHVQARCLADSGVAALQARLAFAPGDQARGGDLLHDPSRFQGDVVKGGNEPADVGGFCILAPAFDLFGQSAGVRLGVEIEAGRLNINSVLRAEQNHSGTGQKMLLGLPGMTDEIAAAILDWLDADHEPRPLGAESVFYQQLDPPYAARNGPLQSVEELLLVRGVTPELLFGRDRNRNYQVDPHEAQPENYGLTSLDATTPALGWATYLTIYTTVPASESASQPPRVWVNQPDMQQLFDELLNAFGNNKQWAMFVVAYRQNGPTASDATLGSATGRELDLNMPGTFSIEHPLDLIGVNVEVVLQGDEGAVVLASPFTAGESLDYFVDELSGKLTVDETPPVSAGVDVMHASPTVLAALPGMSASAVDEILLRRERETDAAADEPLDPLWLLKEGHVSLDEMRSLAPHLQSGGNIYRAQVIGYTRDGKVAHRLEVVVDAGRQPPRLLMCRDLTHLGRGYSLSTLGVADAQRAGALATQEFAASSSAAGRLPTAGTQRHRGASRLNR